MTEKLQITEQLKNFCSNCTQSKLAEELTRAIAALLEKQKVLKQSYFLVDSEARFLHVNNEYCYLAGYSREELLSMKVHDVSPDCEQKVWSEYWRKIQQQDSLTFESLHQTKEGQSVPMEITLSHLEDQGRQYGCAFVQDLSERKQLELALQIAKEAALARSDVHEQLNSEITECSFPQINTQLQSPPFPREWLKNYCSQCPQCKQTEGLTRVSTTLLEKQKILKQSYYSTQRQEVKGAQPTQAQGLPDFKSIFPAGSKLKKVFQFIEENYHQPISVRDVARAVGYSPAYLTDFVKRQTKKSIHSWIVERRMVEACSLLLETDDYVNQIAAKVGYPDAGHFIRQFRQLYSIPPKVWRNQYRQKLCS